MKPEAQRIAIAEACGWTSISDWKAGGINGQHPTEPWVEVIPDYLTDLNAMHEAEVLNFRSISAVERYRAALHGVLVAKFAVESDITSCASHRAEAFLRTLNLWEESE